MAINSVSDLRTELASLFSDLRSGRIDRHIASELNNTIGKMNAANKLELEYHSLRKKCPALPFYDNAKQPT